MRDENIAIAEKNIAAYQPFEFLKAPPAAAGRRRTRRRGRGRGGWRGRRGRGRRGRGRRPWPGRDAAVELEKFERQIVRYNEAAAKVLSVPAGFRATRLTELDCEALNHELANAAIAHAKGCLDAVAHGVVADVSAMNKESRSTVVKLSKKPGNTDELVAAEAYLEHVQGVELPALSRQLAHIQAKVTFLFSHNALSQDVLDFFRSTFISVRDVNEQLTRGGDVLGAERSVIEAELKKHIVEFGEYLDEVGAQVRMFRDKGNPKLIREYIEQVNEVSARLEAAQTQAGEINAEEAKLSMNATFFRQFEEMDAELTPYRQLWSTALSFHQAYSTWVKGHILTLDGEQISRDHAEMLELFSTLTTRLEADGAEEPMRFAQSILQQLERFGMHVPVVRALSDKNLRAGHWAQISSIVGFQLSPENITSLTNLIELSVMSKDKVAQLAAVAEHADAEARAEATLAEIAGAFDAMALVVTDAPKKPEKVAGEAKQAASPKGTTAKKKQLHANLRKLAEGDAGDDDEDEDESDEDEDEDEAPAGPPEPLLLDLPTLQAHETTISGFNDRLHALDESQIAVLYATQLADVRARAASMEATSPRSRRSTTWTRPGHVLAASQMTREGASFKFVDPRRVAGRPRRRASSPSRVHMPRTWRRSPRSTTRSRCARASSATSRRRTSAARRSRSLGWATSARASPPSSTRA